MRYMHLVDEVDGREFSNGGSCRGHDRYKYNWMGYAMECTTLKRSVATR